MTQGKGDDMLFKVLGENGRSCNGGNYSWSLPTKNADGTWTPGEWAPVIEGDLVPCENGYHLCKGKQLLEWLGPTIYEAECDGEQIDSGNKIVVRKARLVRRIEAWNERTARLFAVSCAREALKLIDNPDARSIAACDISERYANGEATADELGAAGAAAGAAAEDAQYAHLLTLLEVSDD